MQVYTLMHTQRPPRKTYSHSRAVILSRLVFLSAYFNWSCILHR